MMSGILVFIVAARMALVNPRAHAYLCAREGRHEIIGGVWWHDAAASPSWGHVADLGGMLLGVLVITAQVGLAVGSMRGRRPRKG